MSASKIHRKWFLPFSVRCTARLEELLLLGTASCQQAKLQADPYTPHTRPVKGVGHNQISAMMWDVNEVVEKHSYFHLLQPRYCYSPAGFLHKSPHEKLEDRFHETGTWSIITAGIQ